MGFGGTDLQDMLAERTTLERNIGSLKGQLTQINDRIYAAVKGPMEAAFARVGQPAGTVKFAVGNHIYKAVIDKRVEWDSDSLEAIARGMVPEQAKELFKWKYTMPEAVFRAMADHPMKAKLAAARTVKYGEPKITADD